MPQITASPKRDANLKLGGHITAKGTKPDNPKAQVARADRYEPHLTAVYVDFGRH